jgi:4-amino-4-deoxy-L-arabinose transferase-like glycosyltransferase
MSFTIISIAHIYIYTQNKKVIDFIIGFVAMAAGLMTKGPISVFMIVASLGSHFLLKKDWKNILNYRYIFGIVIVCFLLIPMCYGLYTQFDLHPEKTVYGIHSPSGIKFFFWTQSFGRITGESSWANNMGFEYLFTNILWAFFPWSLLFVLALIFQIYELIIKRTKTEFISLLGFILTYIALGISRYQLPHYIFITFPLIAVLTAHFMIDKQWLKAHLLLSISITLAIITQFMIVFYIFDEAQQFWLGFIILEIIVAILLFLFLSKEKNKMHQWIVTTAFIAISFNFLFTHLFYKNLLKYQASSAIGKYIKQEHLQAKDINSYLLTEGYNAIHFYARQPILTNELEIPTKKYVITTLGGKNQLVTENGAYKIKQVFEQYNITKLQWKFLNKHTRKQTIKVLYLLEKK